MNKNKTNENGNELHLKKGNRENRSVSSIMTSEYFDVFYLSSIDVSV